MKWFPLVSGSSNREGKASRPESSSLRTTGFEVTNRSELRNECRKMVQPQFAGFMPPQATGQQDSKQRSVPFAFQALVVWYLPSACPCAADAPSAFAVFGGEKRVQGDPR
jgi:hypothetical protein